MFPIKSVEPLCSVLSDIPALLTERPEYYWNRACAVSLQRTMAWSGPKDCPGTCIQVRFTPGSMWVGATWIIIHQARSSKPWVWTFEHEARFTDCCGFWDTMTYHEFQPELHCQPPFTPWNVIRTRFSRREMHHPVHYKHGVEVRKLLISGFIFKGCEAEYQGRWQLKEMQTLLFSTLHARSCIYSMVTESSFS